MGWLAEALRVRETQDVGRLAQLGYKQELSRQLSAFHNFATTLSFLSPITGLTGTYAYIYQYGGPITATWGWLLVSIANFIIGFSLAEICSAYPTSGGVYYWSYQLGGPRVRKLASWWAGWFNLLGQLGATSGVAYTAAIVIANYVQVGTGGQAGASAGLLISQPAMLGIYAAVLLLIGVVNTVTVRALGVVGEISVWCHVIGGAAFIIALPAIAPTHQSAEWVFTTFRPDTAFSGINSLPMMFILSLLGCQWSMVGYDAASHLTEETHAADVSGPISILATIACGFLLGGAYLLSVTFSIQDPNNILGSINPIMTIAWQACEARFGNGLGALVLMVVPLLCILFCCNAVCTSTSRTLYAFSRDRAVPGSRLWARVNPRLQAPVNAVWAVIACCFVLGLPIVHSVVAFTAITSIGVIGLYISYMIPIGLLLLVREKDFPRGPFHLGRASKPVAAIAFFWTVFSCIMFMLPEVLPVTEQTLNYAPVAVGFVLVVSGTYWLVRARRWYDGPCKTVVDEEEDGAVVIASEKENSFP